MYTFYYIFEYVFDYECLNKLSINQMDIGYEDILIQKVYGKNRIVVYAT